MTNFIGHLHEAIESVCPIDGVSIGDESDRTTWRVDYCDAATSQQRAAADQVLASYDPLDWVKADYVRRLAADAEAARLRFLTPGTGKALEYLEKRDQAAAVHAMGEEAARAMTVQEAVTEFPTLVSGLGYDGDDIWSVALVVIGKAEAWSETSGRIASLERSAKAAIQAASTGAEAQAAYDAVQWPAP